MELTLSNSGQKSSGQPPSGRVLFWFLPCLMKNRSTFKKGWGEVGTSQFKACPGKLLRHSSQSTGKGHEQEAQLEGLEKTQHTHSHVYTFTRRLIHIFLKLLIRRVVTIPNYSRVLGSQMLGLASEKVPQRGTFLNHSSEHSLPRWPREEILRPRSGIWGPAPYSSFCMSQCALGSSQTMSSLFSEHSRGLHTSTPLPRLSAWLARPLCFA